MTLLRWRQTAVEKCHTPKDSRIAPAVPSALGRKTTQNDGMGVDKRTGALAGSGVPTARAAALLDVEGATPASHTQSVRLGRALTKTARALGHLGRSGRRAINTPRRGAEARGKGGGMAARERRPRRRRAASSSRRRSPAQRPMARSVTARIEDGKAAF